MKVLVEIGEVVAARGLAFNFQLSRQLNLVYATPCRDRDNITFVAERGGLGKVV